MWSCSCSVHPGATKILLAVAISAVEEDILQEKRAVNRSGENTMKVEVSIWKTDSVKGLVSYWQCVMAASLFFSYIAPIQEWRSLVLKKFGLSQI